MSSHSMCALFVTSEGFEKYINVPIDTIVWRLPKYNKLNPKCAGEPSAIARRLEYMEFRKVGYNQHGYPVFRED